MAWAPPATAPEVRDTAKGLEKRGSKKDEASEYVYQRTPPMIVLMARGGRKCRGRIENYNRTLLVKGCKERKNDTHSVRADKAPDKLGGSADPFLRSKCLYEHPARYYRAMNTGACSKCRQEAHLYLA